MRSCLNSFRGFVSFRGDLTPFLSEAASFLGDFFNFLKLFSLSLNSSSNLFFRYAYVASLSCNSGWCGVPSGRQLPGHHSSFSTNNPTIEKRLKLTSRYVRANVDTKIDLFYSNKKRGTHRV